MAFENGTLLQPPFNGSSFYKIETQTASNDASLDFTGFVDTTKYCGYKLYVEELRPASDGPGLRGRFSTDGGSTWVSTANYGRENMFSYKGGGPTLAGNSSETEMQLVTQGLGNDGTNDKPLCGWYELQSMGKTTHPHVIGEVCSGDTASQEIRDTISTGYNGALVANAFQIYMATGNIASGTVTLFGIPK